MKKTIILTGQEQVDLAIDILSNLILVPVHQLEIKPFKKDRSLAQNSIYWKWLTILGNEYGDSKNSATLKPNIANHLGA